MEITKEKYQNIVKMLQSQDKENHTVALGIIDTLKFDENITQILLMLKHSVATHKAWEEHAPSIWIKLEQALPDRLSHLTYKQVLSTITKLKVKPEEFEFYMQDFSNYLLDQIKGLGYDFIESMEIKIKYKEHEQSRELSES